MFFIIIVIAALTAYGAVYIPGLIVGSGMALYHVLSNELDRVSSRLSEQLAEIDAALKEIREDLDALKNAVEGP